MSKLLKLKQWVTLPEATKHLAALLGEDVDEADVLRLALDGHLTLSVNFVNHTYGLPGKVVGPEELQWGELAAEMTQVLANIPAEAKGQPLKYMTSLQIDRTGKRFLNLEPDVTKIDGVWDLPLVGGERLDVEHEFQALTGGPAITLQNLAGAFVTRGGNTMFQLQERVDYTRTALDVPVENRARRQGKKSEFYPAAGLPENSHLVVRTASLATFVQATCAAEEPAYRPLGERERTTLLTIIAALAQEAGIDISKPSKAGALIEGLTEQIGAPVGQRTIEAHLKRVSDALDKRSAG